MGLLKRVNFQLKYMIKEDFSYLKNTHTYNYVIVLYQGSTTPKQMYS